jgi:hypothetical protein
MTESKPRRRWITLGEFIALAALVVSALGLWLSWKSSQNDGPTRIVEQKPAIALILRGSAGRGGEELVISPVEAGHALESVTIAIPGENSIEVGSDGRLFARDLERALKDRKDGKGSQSITARLTARYVELGRERSSSGNYVIRYRWEGGGLFGGRALKIEGMRRG